MKCSQRAEQPQLSPVWLALPYRLLATTFYNPLQFPLLFNIYTEGRGNLAVIDCPSVPETLHGNYVLYGGQDID